MEPKGPPWDTKEEERAHFIYAFNMQRASDKVIDEAMENLDGYLRVIFEMFQGYVERGELDVLEAMMKEDNERRHEVFLMQCSEWRKWYNETWLIGDAGRKIPNWWDGLFR